MFFPVVMYGCERWTIKKSENQRIDAFELWCWGSLDSKEIKPVNLKGSLRKSNPVCSLEGLILKLQYFGHLMQRADSLEKTPMLGKTESKRRRG